MDEVVTVLEGEPLSSALTKLIKEENLRFPLVAGVIISKTLTFLPLFSIVTLQRSY